ncbi:MAG: hypothetical protein LUE91_06405, partial [Oscillospiraceae bacterium]|nr:hypothetical protein [Oscillospiraceae bacterium]
TCCILSDSVAFTLKIDLNKEVLDPSLPLHRVNDVNFSLFCKVLLALFRQHRTERTALELIQSIEPYPGLFPGTSPPIPAGALFACYFSPAAL